MRLKHFVGYGSLVPTGLALLLALPGCGNSNDDDDASAAASPTPTATPSSGFSSALGSSSNPSTSPSEDGGAGGSDSSGDSGDDASRSVEEGDILTQEGNTLYILNAYRGLEIVDVTNPDKPRLQGHVAMTGYPVEMYVSSGRAYVVVSDYFTYWRVYDTAESPVSSFHGSALAVIDVKNSSSPTLLGKIDLEGYVNQTRQVGDVIYAVSTRYAYSSCDGTTDDTEDMTYVVSVDITDPTSLHTVGDPLSWPGTYAQIHATSNALYVVEPDYNYGGTTTTGGGDTGGSSSSGGSSTGSGSTPSSGSGDGSTPTDTYEYTTDVTYVDISDPHGAMSIRGTTTVPGYVYDKDALNEYDGTFRLVTQKYNGATSGTLTVLDVADPDHLAQLSSLDLVFPEAEYVTTTRFDGDRAVIVTSYDSSTMTFVDLSDPSAPRKAGQLDLSGYVYHLEAVDADQRLVALGQDTDAKNGWLFTVSLFDMSDVDKPAQLDKATIGDGDYSWSQATWDDKAFTLLPEEGLIALPFTAYSYVSDGDVNGYYYYQSTGGVQLLDYSANDLTARGLVSYPGYITRVRPVGDRLVSLNDSHLLTIDATDRDKPQVSADLVLTRNVTDYAPMGDYGVQLTLPTWEDTGASGALRVVSDSDPDNMDQALGSVDLTMYDGQLLTFANNRVGVVRTTYDENYNYTSTLEVFDISKPSNPVSTAKLELPSPVWSWATDYGMYYGSSGGALVRTGDTLAYLQASYYYGTPEPGTDVPPAKARVAQESPLSTLYVIDMSNPDKPALSSLGFDQSLFGLRAEGTTLYATHAITIDPSNARYFADVIDVSNPAAPKVQDPINVPGTVVYSLQDGAVLVTLDQQWTKDENGNTILSYALRTVKIQDGRAYALGSEPLPGYAYSVVSSGTTAYVLSQNYTYYYGGVETGGTGGVATAPAGASSGAATSDAYYPCYYGTPMQLIAIDLSDPAKLKTTSTQDLPISYGYARALSDGRLFIDGSYNGLLVYDVESDPLNPDYVDFAYTSGWAYHVRIAGRKAYLPAGMYGVSVFSF